MVVLLGVICFEDTGIRAENQPTGRNYDRLRPVFGGNFSNAKKIPSGGPPARHSRSASALFDKWQNAQRREIFSPIKADFCRRADARQKNAAQSGGKRSVGWAFWQFSNMAWGIAAVPERANAAPGVHAIFLCRLPLHTAGELSPRYTPVCNGFLPCHKNKKEKHV